MKTLKEIDMNMVKGLMEENYSLAYVDYRDSLDECMDTLEACLTNQNSERLHDDINEWYYDQRLANIREIMKGLKKMLVDMGYKRWEAEKFFEENETEIEDGIFDRDESEPLKQLIRNSNKIPVRLELISNYDCINSHWLESSGGYSYHSTYFGDVIDTLNLNPYKVAQVLRKHDVKVIGYFPNKRSRNGKEYVSYEHFYLELANSVCGANLLTFIATMDIRELIKVNFNLSSVVIPKGNNCSLFSSMYGGGSLFDMELKKDIKLHLTPKEYPYFKLSLEKHGRDYNYSIKQVYGVYDSFFGNVVEIANEYEIKEIA